MKELAKLDIKLLNYKEKVRTKKAPNSLLIWDPVRKKHIVESPEEWVRQLCLQYLIGEKNYSPKKIRVEFGLKVNKLFKRCDILAFDSDMKPFLLVECKSWKIPLNQTVFDQVAMYNLTFKVPYLMITNGYFSLVCHINYDKNEYEFLSDIPQCP